MRKFVEFLIDWCEKRGQVMHITGTDGPDDVYLIRYFVFASRYFNIFIHRFLRSDRDDLHDHPWDFLTYLVEGAYTEYRWDAEHQTEVKTRRVNWEKSIKLSDNGPWPVKRYSFNSLVFRKATDRHKVEVDDEYKLSGKYNAPLTLCITGPRRREWGFWTDMKTFVPWKTYLKLPPDAQSRG